MTITHSKEMLVESLTHIWCKNEIILILFIGIVHTEALASRVGEPRYDIALDTFGTFVGFVSLYPKRRGWCVLNSVVVVDSLIAEAGRLRNLASCDQSLHRTHEGIRALLAQLILY
jgi:hypothetical protein